METWLPAASPVLRAGWVATSSARRNASNSGRPVALARYSSPKPRPVLQIPSSHRNQDLRFIDIAIRDDASEATRRSRRVDGTDAITSTAESRAALDHLGTRAPRRLQCHADLQTWCSCATDRESAAQSPA